MDENKEKERRGTATEGKNLPPLSAPSLYAILGGAPLESRSPGMQEAAFAAAGIDARYVRVAAQSAEASLRVFRETGMSGANVTAPFKERMPPLLDALEKTARETGAVNTLRRMDDGRVVGDNTDPDGVIGALVEMGAGGFEGKSALVVGTGGAALAAAYALAREGAAASIVGRNGEKARRIQQRFGLRAAESLESPGARRLVREARVIVSAVSTRDQVIPRDWLPDSGAFVLDAIYGTPSRLVEDSRSKGLACSDGRAWLIHQGMASFRLWTGRRAVREVMGKGFDVTPTGSQISKSARDGIALLGFSGTGKTTVARAVSRQTGLSLLDLDEEIQRRTGEGIPEIFAKRGEAAFRKLESDILTGLHETRTVLALGGGALIDGRNIPAAVGTRLGVWLSCPLAVCTERIAQSEARPLLAHCESGGGAGHSSDKSHLTDMARQRFSQRKAGYARAADLIVDAAPSTAEVAESIARLWRTVEGGRSVP